MPLNVPVANIDKARDDGQTSLIISSISGHFGTVRILVNAGANTKIRDSQGKTALDYSQEKGHANISAFLRRAISIAENVDEL